MFVPGDKVLLSGPIGDHGITILLARGELDLEADLCSDTRPVLPLVEAMAAAAGAGVRWMRDPTRGGVATCLNELARDCDLCVASSKSACRCAMRCAALANFSAWIRCTSRTRANSWQSSRRSMLTPRSRRYVRRREASECVIIGEMRRTAVRDSAGDHGATGARRVIDMLVGDPLPESVEPWLNHASPASPNSPLM